MAVPARGTEALSRSAEQYPLAIPHNAAPLPCPRSKVLGRWEQAGSSAVRESACNVCGSQPPARPCRAPLGQTPPASWGRCALRGSASTAVAPSPHLPARHLGELTSLRGTRLTEGAPVHRATSLAHTSWLRTKGSCSGWDSTIGAGSPGSTAPGLLLAPAGRELMPGEYGLSLQTLAPVLLGQM